MRGAMGSSNTAGGGVREESAMEDGGADGGASPPEAPAFGTFSEGEKVVAYHGPCLYEAKVQKTEIRKDEWKYFVHYLGWSKSWDEWVAADRLLKFTEENVAKQKFLAKNQNVDKSSKSGRSTQSKPRSSNDAKVDKEDLRNQAPRGKKRKGQTGTEEKSMRSAEKLAMLQFPPTLKKQLVDDWEFVTQLGKIVLEDGKSERITVIKERPASSQHALTEYKVIKMSNGYTWLELCPLTGRKHQLRVHCAEVLKTPIVGDYKYGWHAHRKWEPIVRAKTAKLPKEKLPFGLDFESGSISEKQPRLHLHCRQMVLPNIAEAIQHLDPLSTTNCDLAGLDMLDLVAPLPPYMLLSWDILSF